MIDAVFDYVGVYKERQTHGWNSKVKIHLLLRERERERERERALEAGFDNTDTYFFSLRFYEKWGKGVYCRDTFTDRKPSIQL